ncbi:efflux RND transporter periplasmic adaptor subunit [Crenobacter cavernae]|uniref:Efflux RND transporter periplasmic adaptor subunit n=1 Tax=Crenobacter cavernae TaxID=2290923 RepID=A0ABY0FI67_9NEIS|nr:efflux RND transporter periplasmic adaptor subunit [Crenobacter cavernae]RXZ45296.1 efflux RND transporter periplasmic adaptor subunit [Crenobacter cavernae]
MRKNTIKLAVLVAVVAAASGGAGYWAAVQREAPAQEAGAGPKVLYWYDPMVPNQHFDKPGKSPFMDMQLVPKYADEGGEAAGVKIDPSVVQNLGIRWATVELGTLADTTDVAATVQLNERQVALVQARSAGFVERVYARAPGDVIARGAPMVDLLVPDWAGAQHEFLALLRTGDPSLAQAARERLKLLGMPHELIARVEKTRQARPVVTISSPISGLIQTLDVRAGMSVGPGAPLFKINGLETVWLEAALPEAQAGQVAAKQGVEARLAAYPGDVFKGKVVAVLPEMNAESRTLRVRVELPNRDGRLKPGMFAQVRLDAGISQPVLLVPAEAVIRTGTRNVVLVEQEGGRFQPVEVQLGKEAGGKVAVLSGLTKGQKIVASGQFLIDSEASLKGVMARMQEGSAATSSDKATALYEAVGKVESIKDGEITLSHGPVASLGWGAMTMPFKLARPDMAASLKPGDTVDFGFRQGDGGYVIEKLAKSGGKP